jgi:hypothetical protein
MQSNLHMEDGRVSLPLDSTTLSMCTYRRAEHTHTTSYVKNEKNLYGNHRYIDVDVAGARTKQWKKKCRDHEKLAALIIHLRHRKHIPTQFSSTAMCALGSPRGD